MADIDLPLWSIPPNWKDPLIERLEWKTDVMSSRIATEQRRKVRLSPRRYFEYKVNPVGNVRSFFDQWAHKIGDDAFLHPLWIDKAALDSAVVATGTRLDFPTDYREFEAGGLAVIWKDAFTYEKVEIAAVDANGLDLASPLAADWPATVPVYPIRRAHMSPSVKLKNMTSTVGGATIEIMFDGANDFSTGAEVLTILDGYPVVELEPNRLDDLEQQYNRLMETFDSETGLLYRYDEAVRSFATQFYNWTARGLQANHELRQTIYRLAGRLNPVWMPSFNRDVILAAALDSADTQIDIQAIGYEVTGGFAKGRDHIIMRGDDGINYAAEIDGVGASPGAGQERLTLAAAAGFDASEGRSGSFLDLVRMDQDVVELTHYADTAGATEVSAAFRSFNRDRVPATPLIDPIPESAMGEEPCGTPPETPCDPAGDTGWTIWFLVEYDQTLFDHPRPRSAQRLSQRPKIGFGHHRTNMDLVKDVPLFSFFEKKIDHIPFDPHDHTVPSDWTYWTQWDHHSFLGNWFAPGGKCRIFYKRPGFPSFVLCQDWVSVPNHWPKSITFFCP